MFAHLHTEWQTMGQAERLALVFFNGFPCAVGLFRPKGTFLLCVDNLLLTLDGHSPLEYLAKP